MSETTTLPASRMLAELIAGLRYEALPAEAVHAFKRVFIDYLTCVVTGSRMPVSKTLREYLAEIDGAKTCCVVGTALRFSAPHAAFANGAATHGLDFDDGYTQGSTHPAGATLPAVLAVAEAQGADAKRTICAAVLAYEAMLRIASAIHPVSARRGFHNTPVSGVFGAAAGVSSLLGLDVRGVLNALGLAGSFAGGLREYLDEGAEVKRLHPGKAARDGVICAELAARGMTGPSHVLEGRHGLFSAIADSKVNWERFASGLGTRFVICDAYFKPYPCCRHYHAVIDGIRELTAGKSIAPEAIERVEVGMYEVGFTGHDHRHCENLLDAQMSAPVAAALALRFGDINTASFEPETLARSDVKALIDRVHPYVDEECERIYPGRRSGAVVIHLRDGTTLKTRVVDPRGEGRNPLTDADLERKFLSNCEPVLGKSRAEQLVESAWRFEQLADLSVFYQWE